MFQYTLVQWVAFFYLYCFLGWCFESTYVSIHEKHFVNRGFMHGPFLPLYGSGAIMMLVVSKPFAGNILLTYLAGCVGATVLEYVTGVTMEGLFKVRYWDYSHKKFNYKGHICLESTLFWGVLTIIMTQFFQLHVEKIAFLIPYRVLEIGVYILSVLLAADFAISFKAALDLRDLLIKLEEAKQDAVKVQAKLIKVMENTSEQIQSALEKKGIQLGALRDAVAQKGEDLQGTVLAAWEDKVNSLQGMVDEDTKEKLADLRGEYREWKGKLSEIMNTQVFIKKVSNLQRIHHLRNNPTMKSVQFEEELEELRREMKKDCR